MTKREFYAAYQYIGKEFYKWNDERIGSGLIEVDPRSKCNRMRPVKCALCIEQANGIWSTHAGNFVFNIPFCMRHLNTVMRNAKVRFFAGPIYLEQGNPFEPDNRF